MNQHGLLASCLDGRFASDGAVLAWYEMIEPIFADSIIGISVPSMILAHIARTELL